MQQKTFFKLNNILIKNYLHLQNKKIIFLIYLLAQTRKSFLQSEKVYPHIDVSFLLFETFI